MNGLMFLMVISQLIFTVVAGVYFYQNIKGQSANKGLLDLDSKKEIERLKKMRLIKLTQPLSEKTRPDSLSEVVGQNQGIKALRAALCSPNPQHVIIYGPPGVGKTAAARLILEEAKINPSSPFLDTAKFVELDATTLRFDERSIADPLIGSVHDPIYQGAGAYGPAGVPQPKEGAVTKAHGGVLFIDEIGELHPMQMNKLLKVLEDRVVYMTSSYYSRENAGIPKFIHDIFDKGFPADFRLVGATTRHPEELPPALRSRCTEIYFDGLKSSDIGEIGKNAVEKSGFLCSDDVVAKITQFANNGREAVNIVQTAASIASMEKRRNIRMEDLEWVLEAGRYVPKISKKVGKDGKIGFVNGLAVCNGDKGALLEIEATAEKSLVKGMGNVKVTGIIEEEEIKNSTGIMKRNSCARASVENVMTALEEIVNIAVKDYNVHINFPGGMPVDGPSAGIAIFCAVYSAITKSKISPKIAMTGEISIHGNVLPVGGVSRKIEAAIEAGAELVIIPNDNWQSSFSHFSVKIKRAITVKEVMAEVFGIKDEIILEKTKTGVNDIMSDVNVFTAKGI